MNLSESDKLDYIDVAQSLSMTDEIAILIESGELERIILAHLDGEREERKAFFEDRNSLYWEIASACLSPEEVDVSAVNGKGNIEMFDAAVKYTTNDTDTSIAFDSEVLALESHEDDELATHVIRETSQDGDTRAHIDQHFPLISHIYDSDSYTGDMNIDDHYEISSMHECNSDISNISVCGVFETLHMRDDDSPMDVSAISGAAFLNLEDDIDSGMDCSLLSDTSQCTAFDCDDSAVGINVSFETSSPCHEEYSATDGDVTDMGELSCLEILDTDDFKTENSFLNDNFEIPALFSPRIDYTATAVTDDDSSRQSY